MSRFIDFNVFSKCAGRWSCNYTHQSCQKPIPPSVQRALVVHLIKTGPSREELVSRFTHLPHRHWKVFFIITPLTIQPPITPQKIQVLAHHLRPPQTFLKTFQTQCVRTLLEFYHVIILPNEIFFERFCTTTPQILNAPRHIFQP